MRKLVRAALCGVALSSLVAAAVQAQEATIEVSNAQFDGSSVFIPSATVSERAFVVVHADDPGQTVLGHAVLDPGINENIAVTLSRAPQPGEEFIVMLHEDTGTLGAFEFAEGMEVDRPLLVAGAPLTARLSFAEIAESEVAVVAEPEAAVVAAEAAGIDVSDATHSGNVLNFSSVTMPAGGFLVIHADESGEPILGHAPLQAGINQDVSVTLDRDPAAGETLVAMLHVDEGAPGQFEPEIDEPLVAAEGAVLIGPGGQQLVAAADDPVAVRFRVASSDEESETAAGEPPAERSAAQIPEPEATGSAGSASSGPASAPSGGPAGGSSGGY